jgi:hypothetical protein
MNDLAMAGNEGRMLKKDTCTTANTFIGTIFESITKQFAQESRSWKGKRIPRLNIISLTFEKHLESTNSIPILNPESSGLNHDLFHKTT